MARLQVARTAELTSVELESVRALLYDSFDDMTEADYEHCLGGVHALVVDGGRLVAHGSVIPRELRHDGRTLRTGYVEAVAVRPDQRRRGHGSAVMAVLEEVIRDEYDVGALGATDEAVPFYVGRGWLQWGGTASVVTRTGLERTPEEEGCIYVLPGTAPLTLTGDLACDWRSGDVW